MKGTDKEWQEGSEEIYEYLILTVSPLTGEYEPGEPEFEKWLQICTQYVDAYYRETGKRDTDSSFAEKSGTGAPGTGRLDAAGMK